MRRDGSDLRRLTSNPFFRNWEGGDVDPNVSPDGKLVSFVRIDKAEQCALFVVATGGTDLRQLTPYGLDVASKHDWPRDGKLIVTTTNAAERSSSGTSKASRADRATGRRRVAGTRLPSSTGTAGTSAC